jgi:glycosyltransferase involved in cell wall biosynthesis
MRIAVILPTYRRIESLRDCLEGLDLQERPADEILVIVRTSDRETHDFLAKRSNPGTLRLVKTTVPGVVAALNAGLDNAVADIVAIIDDDAIPHRDWIARIEQHFKTDVGLGGLGGRDVVHTSQGILEGKANVVGKVQWFGRVIGNHHLSTSFKGPVDVLKGVNMAYRTAAIGDLRFDTTLRGPGAQVGNDLAFSLAVRQKGWRLLYDFEVTVDHYPAPRHDIDQRGHFDFKAVENASFNVYWSLNKHLDPGLRRALVLAWECWVGSVGRPGCLRGFAARLARDNRSIGLAHAARVGRHEARVESSEQMGRLNRGADAGA